MGSPFGSVVEQLAKISDLWLYIEPVHLQRPIKGVPPDCRVFGGMTFEIGVLNSTGDGVRWGDSMAEAHASPPPGELSLVLGMIDRGELDSPSSESGMSVCPAIVRVYVLE
jgi:hypothetical protein